MVAKSGTEPRPMQDLDRSVTPAEHVAVATTAAVEAANDDAAESEQSPLGESIAMIANTPTEVRHYHISIFTTWPNTL